MNDSNNLTSRKIKDAIFKTLVITFALLSTVPLLFILFYLAKEGISSLSWDFLVNLPKPVGELGGGISNAIVGTFILVAISSVIAIPIGILLAIYLSEFKKNKIVYFVRMGIDVLQGTPSIVIGIIGYL